jgi:hypothetical protein
MRRTRIAAVAVLSWLALPADAQDGGAHSQAAIDVRVIAQGPVASPLGGPAPELVASAMEWIAIPPEAIAVSFRWRFINSERGVRELFNDGMSIDLVPASGYPSLANIVYADTSRTDLLTDGAYRVAEATIVPGAVSLRISVWNGGDNSLFSEGLIEGVQYSFGPFRCLLVPPYPPPPPPTPPLPPPNTLQFTNMPCPAVAGAWYFMVFTLVGGAFPSGWFFGLDVGLPDLMNQFNAGPPFTGVLDAQGGSTLGPYFGLPTGFMIWAVTTHWTPGYGSFISSRPAVQYTVL